MMPRRELDVLGIAARWTGFLLLVCFFIPAIHKRVAELGFMPAGLAVLAVAVLAGFGGYRLGTHDGRERSHPESVPEQNRPTLRRRYPWRHESSGS